MKSNKQTELEAEVRGGFVLSVSTAEFLLLGGPRHMYILSTERPRKGATL